MPETHSSDVPPITCTTETQRTQRFEGYQLCDLCGSVVPYVMSTRGTDSYVGSTFRWTIGAPTAGLPPLLPALAAVPVRDGLGLRRHEQAARFVVRVGRLVGVDGLTGANGDNEGREGW